MKYNSRILLVKMCVDSIEALCMRADLFHHCDEDESWQ